MLNASGKEANVIPEGWEVVALEKLCDNQAPITYGVLKPGNFYPDGIPLLQIKDMVGGQVCTSNLHRINSVLDNEYKRSRIKENDILISLVGTIGRVAKVPSELDNANIHRNIGRVRSDNHLFLYHFLNSDVALRKMAATSSGSSQSALNLSSLRTIKVPVPPLPEQKKIAQILSTWDKGIATVEKLIANSQQKKKVLMQQLLTGKKRFAGFDGEWKEVRLTDVLNGKKRKGKIVPTNEDQCGMAYIGSTSFEGNFGIYTDSSDAVTCLPNDILVLWDGENAGKVTTGLTGAVSSTVVRYCINQLKADSQFLAYNLLRDNYKVRAIREGSGIPHMPGDFEQWYHIALPTLEEQQKIASVIFYADHEIEIWQQELAHLKQEKKALMQQLLTGKHRVKVDEALS